MHIPLFNYNDQVTISRTLPQTVCNMLPIGVSIERNTPRETLEQPRDPPLRFFSAFNPELDTRNHELIKRGYASKIRFSRSTPLGYVNQLTPTALVQSVSKLISDKHNLRPRRSPSDTKCNRERAIASKNGIAFESPPLEQ